MTIEDALNRIADAVEKVAQSLETIEIVVVDEDDEVPIPPPTEPPTNPPSNPDFIQVSAKIGDKAVVFLENGVNKVGKPIINKKLEPVVKWENGAQFNVYPIPVDADGSIDYYEVYPRQGGVPWYVRADKIVLS